MAIVPRKRKTGTVYYVSLRWHGKQLWEPAGTSKRAAEQLDRKRKKEIAAGTYKPHEGTKALTLWQWFESWIDSRTVRSAKDEERWIRLHVLPRHWLSKMPLADVRPKHCDQLIGELKAERKLSEKSIANVMGVLSVLFKAAHRAEHCTQNPVSLERGALSRDVQSERETYSGAEVRVLTRHAAIEWPIRVLNALAFYTGMREGEVCGRKWRDLHDDADPLGALHVHCQYGGGPLKTDRPRMVPVHPELGEVLEHWGREGFELYIGRKPTADDYIVPNASPRAKQPHHTKSSYYKAFQRSCKAAGIRSRTLHSTRHTFTTLCRRGGAPKDLVTKITHNPKGTIVDRYTHYDWEPLCAAVLKLDLDARQHVQPGSGSSGENGSGPRWLGRRIAGELPPAPTKTPSSIPGVSTTFQQKTRGLAKSRQHFRQHPGGSLQENGHRSDDRDADDFALALGESAARAEAFEATRRKGGR